MSNTGDRPKPPNAGKGRPKGSVNKTTASVKAALTEAFELKGGIPSFLKWAEKNETEFYAMWSKMLPAEVDVTSNGETIGELAAAMYARALQLRAEQQPAMIDAPQQRLIEAPAILS